MKDKKMRKKILDILYCSDIKNSNANVDEYSFGGRKFESAGLVLKDIALNNLIDKKVAKAHKDNYIYIHDLDNYATGMHNCYDAATKFVTKTGVKRFGDCYDGQIVQVVDKSGNWRSATVHKYNKQKMYDMTFTSGRTTKKVTCTRNHRWVLSDGTITNNIQVGDSLILTPEINNEFTRDDSLWCFGFTLGDGCDYHMKSKNRAHITNRGMLVRLCGDKISYLDRFLQCGWSIREKYSNGDITVHTRGNGAFKQAFLDNKIWKIMSYNDLCNIFDGYIHADGHFKDNGSIMVSTSDERIKEMIEDISSVNGYYVWSENKKANDTNYKKDRILYEFYLTKKQRVKWTLTKILPSRCGSGGYKTAWCVDEPVTHTFTLDGGMVTGNCLFIDFKKLFENGFETRNGDVRPPRSISTAMQQMAVIMQCQSQVEYGGVASMHADFDLAPFVKYSFAKHYKDGLKYLENKEEVDYEIEFMLSNPVSYSIEDAEYKAYSPKAYKYAIDMLEKEGRQAAQGLYHNLNTLESRAGSQLPFSSLDFGRDTTPEGRCITKWLLQASIDGIGKHHRTPIFPISIFQLKEGVNKNPGDPNYDLKLLALESTSKRLYPNYVNGDWSNVNEDESNPDTYMATMGAVAGFEHLYLKINGCRPIDISIEDFFYYCKTGELKGARPCQVFFNKEETNVLREKPRQERNSYKSTGGVYSITYLPEDITYIGSTGNISRRFNEHRYNIRLNGGLDAGICFGDCNLNSYRFEVLEYTNTYKEQEKKYIETIPNINYRGTTQRYYKNTHGNKIIHERPVIPQDYSIKQDLINLENMDIKVLDRNNTWVKIKHIFKNDKRNSPLMMHIYYKEYDKTYCLTCTEDHPLWTGESFIRADNIKTGDTIYRADNLPLKVIDISYHHTAVDSYDIGTYTGSFIISDIICHNCRTIVGSDRNGLGNVKVGRGNISPITIVLPKLGIKYGICKGKRKVPNLKGFWKELDKVLAICEKGLVERCNYIANQNPKSAPFMYKNGTAQGYNKCINNVEEMVKHGTNAIGMIGLAETLEALFGKNHADEGVREFGREIVERIYKYTLEASNRTGLNFSCYFTPAEGCCYTIMQKLKDEFGITPKVTENEYLTNSIHVPVWEKINIFDKIDIESEFTKYGTGGCITYVEFDSSIKNNTKALEQVIDYAMEQDIPYLAINFPIDTCLDCGLSEEINSSCPRCGSDNIEHLARVTGYLSVDYRNFNKGKQREVEMRFKHSTITNFEE